MEPSLQPTEMKVLFPYVTPVRLSVVPEVFEVHVVPSEEVRMVPPLPTATYNPLVVVVVELLDDSSFSAQEKTVRLKRDMRIMYKTLFIFFLH